MATKHTEIVCSQAERIARIEEHMKNTDDNIAEIKKALLGNGQPGLLSRMSRIETTLTVFLGGGGLFTVAIMVLALIFG